MSATDETMKDLVWTATRATTALDRRDWTEVLNAARRLEEHGMRLASLATKQLVTEMPIVGNSAAVS